MRRSEHNVVRDAHVSPSFVASVVALSHSAPVPRSTPGSPKLQKFDIFVRCEISNSRKNTLDEWLWQYFSVMIFVDFIPPC